MPTGGANRRRALATSVLIVLSAILYGFTSVVLGLGQAVLGATLAIQGIDAYGPMGRWMRSWDHVPAAIGAFGGLE